MQFRVSANLAVVLRSRAEDLTINIHVQRFVGLGLSIFGKYFWKDKF